MKKNTLIFVWIVLQNFGFAFSQTQEAPLVVESVVFTNVTGILKEKGTQTPLVQTAVYLLPHNFKALTDAQGFFKFEQVPLGPIELVVNLSGYSKLVLKRTLSEKTSFEKLFLEKESYQNAFETTVVSNRNKRDEVLKTITQKEILTSPGSGGDALKAAQNLAGINRSAGFDSNIVIQGSDLVGTSYLIDGHEVPLVFHFGGLSTVMFSEAIDSVDYLSAGYGPEYGRALGGLIGLRTREPRTDRMHGLAFVDVINAGGLVEGPLSKNAGFMVSVRQSYIGEVLKTVLDSDSLQFSSAPKFTDINAVLSWKPNADVSAKLTGIGSQDSLELFLKESGTGDSFLKGNLSSEVRFFRLIPSVKVRHGEDMEGNYSLGVGWSQFKFGTDTNAFNLRTGSLTPRAEVIQTVTLKWKTFLGVDARLTYANVDAFLPATYQVGGVFNPIASGDDLFVDTKVWFFEPAFYLRNELRLGNWTFSPSGRFEYYSSTGEAFVDPRLAVAFQARKNLKFRLNGGRYHQAPEPQEISKEVGNPELKTPQAWHLAFGADVDFRGTSTQGFTLSTGPFFRWFDDLVAQSTQSTLRDGVLQPEFYNNSAKGHVIGGEATLKFTRGKFESSLAFTLLKSRRKEPGLGEYPAAYDQTHNINWLAGINLPRNWRISSRLRYVTGNPITPVTGAVFDSDHNVYVPVRGPLFSDRNPDFFQWDVRVDKKWVFNQWMLSLYLDVQNATHRKNVEGVQYAYDYSSSVATNGLPVIPTLGVKGEF